MSSLYPKIDEADWSFVGTWQQAACDKAAERVARNGGKEFSDSLDDLKQHAYLYVATHAGAMAKMRTEGIYIDHVASRIARDFQREWGESERADHYGSEVELYEGSGWDV